MHQKNNSLKKRPSILLGVNIDHVATLRQARTTSHPDPIEAALIAEQSGADSITVHLREDRRHIQDEDVIRLKKILQLPINLEMAVTEEMITLAEKMVPQYVCLVPEKRRELTTEGGLNVNANKKNIAQAIRRLSKVGCHVSLFIDPELKQIEMAKKVNAAAIEIHTGAYAESQKVRVKNKEYQRIVRAAYFADSLGLRVNAGHGLNYENTSAIAQIPMIHELNIGHAIVAKALWIGFKSAIRQMKKIMLKARYAVR